jgi:hypothetical protein
VATGVSGLSFQPCTPSGGQFVCPFTVTFDWNDPGGTGGVIAWHLGGSVVSKTNRCVPMSFRVAETTPVPPGRPGAQNATITGTLTVSSDPAGKGLQSPSTASPSTATASLDGVTGPPDGPVPFYGGSTC